MPNIIEICADEAWTHTNPPLNRYWCMFGGIVGNASDIDRLETALRHKMSHLRREVKWSNVDDLNFEDYKLLIDELFIHMEERDIRYRQLFLDRQFVLVKDGGIAENLSIDTQFKIYYQFLKHSFGLRYLPVLENGDKWQIFFRLDNHSSQKHKNNLTHFVTNLSTHFGRNDLDLNVRYVESHQFARLQVCDVLMGAAGSYGNKMHLRRQPGQRGMTRKQSIRFDLAKYIYGKMRELNSKDRGSNSFNWFATTGIDGDIENVLGHKIRIWNFIPKSYKIDKGWQNSNLSSRGEYIAPDISDAIHNRE